MNKVEGLKAFFRQYNTTFHPIVPFDAIKDKLIAFDFTSSNTSLDINILHNLPAFIQWVDVQLINSNARYGIGGYAEHRTVYSASKVFDPVIQGDEPRRLHLGTDIWGKPQTAVMTPLDGIVHSFAYNDNFGDYGATVILVHNIEGFFFYTLYGHLSLNSIRNKQEGQRIRQGEIFAEFGIPAENGQWPPHLHFQIILDIGNYKGDYPGVCRYSEKEKYLANSPNADIILGLSQYLTAFV
jgi:murein DD-endopeptidase MepM/ murein hydrolase activator NlpD